MSTLKSRTNQPVSSDDKLLEQVSFDGTKVLVKKPVEVVGSIKSTGLEVDSVISSSNKLLLSGALLAFGVDIEYATIRLVSDGATNLIISLEALIVSTSAQSLTISGLPQSLMQSLVYAYPQYFPATNSLGGAGKVTIDEVDGSGAIVVNIDAGAERIIYTTIILSKNLIEV